MVALLGCAGGPDRDGGYGAPVADAGTTAAGPGQFDDCAGIVPKALGQSVDVSAGPFSYSGCDDRSTSDGEGAVLLGVEGGLDFGANTWTPYSASGAGTLFGATPDGQAAPYPLDAGFEWFTSGSSCDLLNACNAFASIGLYSHDGTALSSRTLYSASASPAGIGSEVLWGSANDPGRGLVVTHLHRDLATTHWVLLSQRFDSAAAPLGSASTVAEGDGDAPTAIANGVGDNGDSLTLFARPAAGSIFARWMDPAGASASDIFQVAPLGTGTPPTLPRMELFPLIGGAVALKLDGAWSSVIPGRTPAPQPVPSWLAGASPASLTTIRGGKGYALFSKASECAPQHIELIAASGTQCGSVDLPLATGCVHAATSGFDGTVILSGSANGVCTRSYWPQLLK